MYALTEWSFASASRWSFGYSKRHIMSYAASDLTSGLWADGSVNVQ